MHRQKTILTESRKRLRVDLCASHLAIGSDLEHLRRQSARHLCPTGAGSPYVNRAFYTDFSVKRRPGNRGAFFRLWRPGWSLRLGAAVTEAVQGPGVRPRKATGAVNAGRFAKWFDSTQAHDRSEKCI